MCGNGLNGLRDPQCAIRVRIGPTLTDRPSIGLEMGCPAEKGLRNQALLTGKDQTPKTPRPSCFTEFFSSSIGFGPTRFACPRFLGNACSTSARAHIKSRRLAHTERGRVMIRTRLVSLALAAGAALCFSGCLTSNCCDSGGGGGFLSRLNLFHRSGSNDCGCMEGGDFMASGAPVTDGPVLVAPPQGIGTQPPRIINVPQAPSVPYSPTGLKK